MAKRTELTKKIGQAVRSLRQKQGLSQEEFADRCGVHRTYIGFVERGERSMLVETADIITRGLGMSLSEFFAAVEEEPMSAPKRQSAKMKSRK